VRADPGDRHGVRGDAREDRRGRRYRAARPSGDIGANAIKSFFRAAANLFRAKPWEVVPSDQGVFSVTIEKLDLRDAALSVIGQMGQSLGFILFSGIDDFEAYLDAANAMARRRFAKSCHLRLAHRAGTS
jgi:hypothetical protein